MARGGKRIGAGRRRVPTRRKPSAQAKLTKEAMREFVRQQVAAALGPLVAAQIANAQGVSHLVTRDAKTGKFTPVEDQAQIAGATEVWLKQPNVQAFTDLLNRALDKPAEQIQEINVSGNISLISRLHAARQRLSAGTES